MATCTSTESHERQLSRPSDDLQAYQGRSVVRRTFVSPGDLCVIADVPSINRSKERAGEGRCF